MQKNKLQLVAYLFVTQWVIFDLLTPCDSLPFPFNCAAYCAKPARSEGQDSEGMRKTVFEVLKTLFFRQVLCYSVCMKRTINWENLLLVSLFVVFLSSCATVGQYEAGVGVPSDPYIASDTVIYIRTEGLNWDIAESIAAVVEKHGLSAVITASEATIPDLSTKSNSGTCFSIAPSYAVTCAHVLKYQEKYLYVDEVYYPISIVEKDDSADLAIIKIEGYSFPYSFGVQLEDNYELGADVYSLGFPVTDLLGQDIRLTKGIINSNSGLGGDKREIQISAEVQPGNSGGPVVYASDCGKVLGIVSSTVSDLYSLQEKGSVLQNVNFAIKSSVLNSLYGNYLVDISKNTTNRPTNLQEAASATGLVFTTETPTSEYGKRLMMVLKLDRTYYEYLGYRMVASLRFLDVDRDNYFESYYVQSYNSASYSEVAGIVMDDFLTELENRGLLINGLTL